MHLSGLHGHVRNVAKSRRPPRRFGVNYVQHVLLRDGRRARIVALRPFHAPQLLAGFARLSPESKYMRFFAPKPCLSPAEVRYFTQLDGERHYALGVEVETAEGWDGAGVVRIVRDARQPDRADLAVTVIDDYQGCGLGKLLVDRALDAAAERGFREVVADVLAENGPMMRVFKQLVPTLRCEANQYGVRRLVMPLVERRRQLRCRPPRLVA